MGKFDARRISCPVHGTIGFSELEMRVINTRVFQRLRHVKHLGLAHYVFPGADFSRFSHSLGACHITGRVLTTLQEHGANLKPGDLQLYRLAALLHDVGHYPFSHAMEHAISNFYSEALMVKKTAGAEEESASVATAAVAGSTLVSTPAAATTGPAPSNAATSATTVEFAPDLATTSYKHERVGKEILLNEPELYAVLKDHDPARVTAVFTRQEPPPFSNLVSSDLDADRIDYLLRTAHHTGLPYGDVDLNYLISQMRVDEDQRVCLTSKAVRAADHLLLCRYFDFQQVASHKTVAALELVLKDVLEGLLHAGLLECSAKFVSDRIKTQDWTDFDDGAVFQIMRRLVAEGKGDDVLRRKATALLRRSAPKLICEREYIGPRREETQKDFRLARRLVREHVTKWAEACGVDERFWYVWTLAGWDLTKVGASVPITAAIDFETEDEEAVQQVIRVLDVNGKSSRPIVGLEHSLLKILADHALYALRVYVLLPEDDPQKQLALKKKIQRTVKEDLPEVGWK